MVKLTLDTHKTVTKGYGTCDFCLEKKEGLVGERSYVFERPEYEYKNIIVVSSADWRFPMFGKSHYHIPLHGRDGHQRVATGNIVKESINALICSDCIKQLAALIK